MDETTRRRIHEENADVPGVEIDIVLDDYEDDIAAWNVHYDRALASGLYTRDGAVAYANNRI